VVLRFESYDLAKKNIYGWELLPSDGNAGQSTSLVSLPFYHRKCPLLDGCKLLPGRLIVPRVSEESTKGGLVLSHVVPCYLYGTLNK